MASLLSNSGSRESFDCLYEYINSRVEHNDASCSLYICIEENKY